MDQKRLYTRTSSLVKTFGGKPPVTVPQARRLDSLGFTFDGLVELHSDSKSDDAFCTILKDKGVKSKPLREKLVKCLHALGK